MDIVYIDPGYGAGLAGVTCVENEEYNPINGVAFKGSRSVNAPNSAGIISVRFSAYFGSDSSGIITVKSSANYATIGPTSCTCFTGGNSGNTSTSTYSLTGFHNFVVSFGMNITTSLINHKVVVTGDLNHTVSGWYNNSGASASSYRQNIFNGTISINSPETYISNIIVATDTSYSPCLTTDMLLVKLPLKNTSGDFLSVGDGEYVGNTAGQTLLSTINAGENSDVITKFGATGKVSHIVTYGNPGYRVGSNIETAYGISQSGNDSITAHGNCSLSTANDANAFVAWEADSGTKLSDLDGLKVGWQV
ncbi:MAG: hypothetical protein IJK81_13325 [Selenomonadaceae bacterium]|nr:hypothetical protein [Selenomonadaceae bacterium]